MTVAGRAVVEATTLVRRTGRIDPLAVYERCVQTQARWAIATVVGGPADAAPIGARTLVDPHGDPAFDDAWPVSLRDAIVADARAARVAGTATVRKYDGGTYVLIEAIVPPPRLFVFGAGHDVVPVIQRARAAGWHTTVCAPQLPQADRSWLADADEIARVRPDEIEAKIDASDRAVGLVMSHRDDDDRDALAMLLGSLAAYIGVVGSRERTHALLECLGRADARSDARLRAADSPIAILSDIETALQPPSR